MEVQIIENDKVIWARDSKRQYGITATKYAQDRTLEKIIDELEEAIVQAKGQLWAFGNEEYLDNLIGDKE